MEARFDGPKGENTYRVELEQLIPVGPHHQFFGGAGTNIWMHGSTGIGEPFMPATFSYGHPEDAPLPTGIDLPNGKEQPFVHFNFYGNIQVEGNKFIS